MSAVNNSTFANKKPVLEGDVTTVTTGPESSTMTNFGLSGLQSGDVGVGGFSFTPTTEKNVSFLRISVYVTNNAFVRILEGATILASAGGSGTGTRTVSFVVKDTSIGLHSYSYTIVRNGLDYQYGNGGNNSPISTGSGVDIIDTHAAELIGENTQKTHETEVLP